MGNIHFRLNRGAAIKDNSKLQSIFIRYQIGGKVDLMASTKLKVLVKDWDFVNERYNRPKKHRNHLSGNGFLDKLEGHFKDFDNDNTRKGYIPSYKEVREHFKGLWVDNSEKKEKGTTIFDFIRCYIETEENNKSLSSGTLKSYRLGETFFKEYSKKVESISFENIDIDWYKRFISWCNKKQYSTNYIGKNVKFLKLMLKKAFELNWSSNDIFRHSDFKVLKEEVENIYLNEVELKKMWELDLSNFPEHEKVRDIFLIGCYTGLRFSDFKKVKRENVLNYNGKEILKITPTKTKKPIAIPLHPIVKEVMTKYNYEPPKNLYEQKINNLIKEVGEWAGIDNEVFFYVSKGGKKEKVTKQKFELIKTHTARRSFCTNAHSSKIPIIDIMTISGHTSERTFINYIKNSPEEKAQRISEYSFFN